MNLYKSLLKIFEPDEAGSDYCKPNHQKQDTENRLFDVFSVGVAIIIGGLAIYYSLSSPTQKETENQRPATTQQRDLTTKLQ